MSIPIAGTDRTRVACGAKTIGQATTKENTGYRPYTDVQNDTYEAFFCACNPRCALVQVAPFAPSGPSLAK